MPPKLESDVPRNPPSRGPITHPQASDVLRKLEKIMEDYLSLVTTFDVRDGVIAALFQRVGLLGNNREIQENVDRANVLLDRIENSYGNNPTRTRDIQEKYDQLDRIHKKMRRDIDLLQAELERMGSRAARHPRPRPAQSSTRPRTMQQPQQPQYQPQSMLDPLLPPQSSKRPGTFQQPQRRPAPSPPAGPSQRPPPPQASRPVRPVTRPNPNHTLATAEHEILRLRDENRSLRKQYSVLSQELAEARSTIRSMQELQGREDYDREDMRGEKRRRQDGDERDDMRANKRRRY